MEGQCIESKVLILCALREEAVAAASLVRADDSALVDVNGLCRGSRCLIAVTGPLEHSMVAQATGLILNERLYGNTISHIVNFGAAGAYPTGQASLGDNCLVGVAGKWDMGFPLPGYEPHLPDFHLSVPVGALAVADHTEGLHCLTGATFSSDEVRDGRHFARRGRFPQGDLEDMELYALASLSATIGLPLTSVKFVTNMTDQSAVTEFETRLVTGAEAALPLLGAVLTSLGAIS